MMEPFIIPSCMIAPMEFEDYISSVSKLAVVDSVLDHESGVLGKRSCFEKALPNAT